MVNARYIDIGLLYVTNRPQRERHYYEHDFIVCSVRDIGLLVNDNIISNAVVHEEYVSFLILKYVINMVATSDIKATLFLLMKKSFFGS